MAPHDDAANDPMSGLPVLGPSGHPFPSEQEWLDLQLPDEDRISDDFVARTLQALGLDPDLAAASADEADGTTDDLLTPQVLATFLAPEPSTDFVARTLAAMRQDQRTRWREVLARHTAPEPSPQFVARTLAALAEDPEIAAGKANAPTAVMSGAALSETRPSESMPTNVLRWPRRLGRVWPLLTIAALAVLWFSLSSPPGIPLELRLARQESRAFAHSHAPSPLPALLTMVARTADPRALPSGGADGAWLLLGDDR